MSQAASTAQADSQGGSIAGDTGGSAFMWIGLAVVAFVVAVLLFKKKK